MSESPTPEIAVDELAAIRMSGVLVEAEEYVAGPVPGAELDGPARDACGRDRQELSCFRHLRVGEPAAR